MVNLIENWDVLEEYAGEKLGFYQLLSNDGIIEIRVQIGRIGFKKEFTAGNDTLLTKILDFCKKTTLYPDQRKHRNTLIYTQLVTFQNDDYICKAANNVKEATDLIEAGFEYVCEMATVKLFRKRK